MPLPNPPAPATMSVGGAITSGLWNTNVRDAVTFLANPPLAVVYQAVAQSIPNNTTPWTALTFDSTLYDTYSGHSNVTNNSRWTCPATAPGYYEFTGGVAFAANATGVRAIGPFVNGNAEVVAMTLENAVTGAGVATCIVAGSLTIQLNAGDYVQMGVYQNSGGALSTLGTGQFQSYMSLRWVHA